MRDIPKEIEMPQARTILSPALTAFALNKANSISGGQFAKDDLNGGKFNRSLNGNAQEVTFIRMEMERLSAKRDLLFKKITETQDEDAIKSISYEIDSLQSQINSLQNKLTSIDMSDYAMYYMALSTVSGGLSAFHGYRRNESIPWAIVWGLMGGLFPIFTPVIAVAQGFGKKKETK